MTLTEYRVSFAKRAVRARLKAHEAYMRNNPRLGEKRNNVARRHEQALGMLIASDVINDWEARP